VTRRRRRPAGRARGAAAAALGWLVLLASPAPAQLALPPGFAAEPYVTGEGFDTSGGRGAARGIPAVGTLAFDRGGTLYLARTGARFRSGDVEDLWPVYRIPPGGARLTAATEAQFLYGPPLPNPQIGGVSLDGLLWLTTFDRDRRLGALYRVTDGRPTLFAGGRPVAGEPPLLRHPEGVAVDATGHLYVTDREQDAVLRLDRGGGVVSAAYARLTRPRMLAFDATGHLWVAGDGSAETPFGAGQGEVWRIAPDGTPRLVLRGPLPAGIAPGPGGTLFVAQRRTGQVFALTPDGRRIDFGAGQSGSFLRGLAFAPDTPETRRAGLAGALFLVVVPRAMWLINDVVRVTGPFEEWLRAAIDSPRP
jgi:sugar lactone lactonase YvrE